MNTNQKKKFRLSTFQLISLGFAALILFGTLLLMMPFSSASGQFTPFNEALFTATSASCVTGLIVHDTATYWSPIGQGIILLLIQTGGLGIVSMVILFSLISGKKISIRSRGLLQDAISAHQFGGIIKRLRFIFTITFAIEVAGMCCLLPVFCARFGTEGIWMSVFHAISAFCNAGFDLMGSKSGPFTSLTLFHDNGWLTTVISLLIIFGGIGFLTWEDITTHRLTFKKYKMQSKVILVTSGVLILIPAVFYFLFEYQDAALGTRIWESIFQAVTPRTAGFNTTDLTQMSQSGRALMIVLMLIGGSPGSTAGGMKTTTIAVLFANIAALFHHNKEVSFFKRRIDDEVVKNAAVILLLYVVLCLGSAIAIAVMEGLPFETCVFETASAVGTVGLTLGLTPSLGIASQIILVLLMFLGRVGGMTILLSAANPRERVSCQHPLENIIVG